MPYYVQGFNEIRVSFGGNATLCVFLETVTITEKNTFLQVIEEISGKQWANSIIFKIGSDGLIPPVLQAASHPPTQCLLPRPEEESGEPDRRRFWRAIIILVLICKAILEYDVAGRIEQFGRAERDNSSNAWSLDIHSSVIH